mgnify:CR=1 FL=1
MEQVNSGQSLIEMLAKKYGRRYPLASLISKRSELFKKDMALGQS